MPSFMALASTVFGNNIRMIKGFDCYGRRSRRGRVVAVVAVVVVIIIVALRAAVVMTMHGARAPRSTDQQWAISVGHLMRQIVHGTP